MHDWLVVSTHLKNISQNGNLPQVGVKIKNIWNHQPDDVGNPTVPPTKRYKALWSREIIEGIMVVNKKS